MDIRTDMGRSALHLAARVGFKDICEFLVNAGTPIDGVDADNRTALYFAADAGFVYVVQFLASRGADSSAKDSCGRTSADAASARGHPEIVDFLNLVSQVLPLYLFECSSLLTTLLLVELSRTQN